MSCAVPPERGGSTLRWPAPPQGSIEPPGGQSETMPYSAGATLFFSEAFFSELQNIYLFSRVVTFSRTKVPTKVTPGNAGKVISSISRLAGIQFGWMFILLQDHHQIGANRLEQLKHLLVTAPFYLHSLYLTTPKHRHQNSF